VAVRALGGGVHLLEDDLGDLHLRSQDDGQCRDVRQLEDDGAGEARVDIAGRGVDEQPEPSEAGLAVDDTDDVVGEDERLGGVGEGELVRDAARTGRPCPTSTRSIRSSSGSNGSMWVAWCCASPGTRPEPNIDRGWLDEVWVVGVDDQSP
jgi:hypothetical protein